MSKILKELLFKKTSILPIYYTQTIHSTPLVCTVSIKTSIRVSLIIPIAITNAIHKIEEFPLFMKLRNF